MRRVLGALIGAALLTTAMMAMAAPPREARRLEPASRWVLDYADERCSLRRNFGGGDQAVLLQIDSFGSWNGFHVTLSGTGVPRSNRPIGRGSFRFTVDRHNRDASMLQGTAGAPPVPAVALTMSFAPDSEADPEGWDKMSAVEKGRFAAGGDKARPDFDRAVDTIRVVFDRGSPVELHVEPMGEPLAAMRACIDDLYKSWGIEPAGQKALSALAVPLPSTIKHVQKDYPGRKLLGGISAFVPVRLLVDENGQATSCVVQSTGVDADFKQAVCANLQARFQPAHGAAGKPVRSMYHTAVRYLMAG